MPLFGIDVLESKDIKEIRKELEELLASIEFSVELSIEDGKLKLRLATTPRSQEDRLAMLSKLAVRR